MGRRSRAQAALYDEMRRYLQRLQDDDNNPAQKWLTQHALGAANWLTQGDYSQLPKGMFYNFEMPEESNRRAKRAFDVNQLGTFSLGDNGGRTKAAGLQTQYLKDRFARDTSLNYQNNIAQAAGNIQNALAQASGAKTGMDSQIISAFNSLNQSPWLKRGGGNNWLGGLMQAGAQIGSAFI